MEVGVRPARRFDDTRKNLAPQLARILILNQHQENYDEAPPAAAVFLMIALMENYDTIFGYTKASVSNIKTEDGVADADIATAETKQGQDDNGTDIPSGDLGDKMTINEQPRNEEKVLVTEKSLPEVSSKSPEMPNDQTKSQLTEPKKAEHPKYRDYTVDYTAEIEAEVSADKDVIREASERIAAKQKELELKKDARTRALEKTIQKYLDKIRKHKTEVQDKYILQDWQDRVEASRKLLQKHLKVLENEQIKQQELNREQRVSDALEAAKILKEDREGFNLVQLRQTLKRVKMMWVRARSTNLSAINGSLGDGNDANLDLRAAMRKSEEALSDIGKTVGYMRDRHLERSNNLSVMRIRV